MNAVVEGVKSLFAAPKLPDTKAQDQAASVAIARQQQELQAQQAQRDSEIARARKAPKGRRLLLAATGETGISNTLG